MRQLVVIFMVAVMLSAACRMEVSEELGRWIAAHFEGYYTARPKPTPFNSPVK